MPPPDSVPLDYGKAFATNVRFRTEGGEAPVLRLLWRKEDGSWRSVRLNPDTPQLSQAPLEL
jgi:hypothetical protein